MKKILITVTSVTMLLTILSPATALAASPVIVNGSFETGDYTGWTLWEGNPEGWYQYGTWGIAYDGEAINPSQQIWDFCDEIMVTQRSSPGLPITFEATDGEYLAYQLQAGPQDHRMYQDIELPVSAATLSWDMFYDNHAGAFSGSQYLAVRIRDPLNDSVLETLFKTGAYDLLDIPMTHFTYDISAYAGSEVRIDVEMVVQNYFIDAGFDNFVIDQNEYTVTATAGTGGTISPSGDVTVTHGDSQTFTITADAGYYIDDVLVDEISVGAVESYTFTGVEANHAIEATFGINTYTITPTAGDGGTISPPGDVTLNHGDSQTFTITADAGYYIDDVLVDEISVGAVGSYTFTGVEANHTIEATFAINTYTITATAGDGGAISPSGDVTINNGDSQAFTITPDAGYYIDDVLVDGVSVDVVSSSPGSYTFNSVEADHTIEATFAKGPPGWDKESKEGWNGPVPPGLDKKDKTPPGFDKGNKTGWDKVNTYGWNGLVPPGLDKKDKTPPGFDKGNKNGWK